MTGECDRCGAELELSTELTVCAYCGIDLTDDPATAADSAGHMFCDGSHRADYWCDRDGV